MFAFSPAAPSLLVERGVHLGAHDALLAAGAEHGDHDIPVRVHGGRDLVADLSLGHLEVVPGLAALVHEREEAVVHADELVLLPLHVGHLHVVGGGTQLLQLLAREDVERDQVDLGVAVLAGLGGGHVHDLGGAPLDHHEAALAQRRALHRESVGRSGVGAAKIEFFGHFYLCY